MNWQQTTVYTIQEKVEIVLIHAAGMSVWEAAKNRWHPDQPIPYHAITDHLLERFKATGSIHNDPQIAH